MNTGRTVIRTVRCGACFAESRPKPNRLGRVERDPEGRVWWVEHRNKQAPQTDSRPDHGRMKWVNRALLADPTDSQFTPPPTIAARCPRHGLGGVSSYGVLTGPGNVVLTLSATA